MGELHKVKDTSGFLKDSTSGAVINIDTIALDSYKKQKDMFNRLFRMEKEIYELKEKVRKLESIK